MKERERVRKKERKKERGKREEGGREGETETEKQGGLRRGERGIMDKFFPHCLLYHMDYSETWKFIQPLGSHAQVTATSCACYAAVASLGHVPCPPLPCTPAFCFPGIALPNQVLGQSFDLRFCFLGNLG